MPEKSNRFVLSHIPALDGLRGVAIVSVVLFHSKFILGGYLGVDIFFVLSGFLITSLLVREWTAAGTISLKSFYIRRALRLGPALLAVLVSACLYETLFWPFPGVKNIFVRSFYTLTHFGNWVWAFAPDEHPLASLDATWSLAIEEQFYILWPVATLFMLKRKTGFRLVGCVLGSLIVASLTWRLWLWRSGAHAIRLYAGTDTHADPILIGCLTSVLAHAVNGASWRKIEPWAAAMAPFILVVLIGVLIGARFPSEFILLPTIVAVLSAFLILNVTVMSSTPITVFFGCRLLTFLGMISYGLYLWHSVLVQYLQKQGLIEWRFLQIVAGLILAIISWSLIERPIMNLKDRFARRMVKSSVPENIIGNHSV